MHCRKNKSQVSKCSLFLCSHQHLPLTGCFSKTMLLAEYRKKTINFDLLSIFYSLWLINDKQQIHFAFLCGSDAAKPSETKLCFLYIFTSPNLKMITTECVSTLCVCVLQKCFECGEERPHRTHRWVVLWEGGSSGGAGRRHSGQDQAGGEEQRVGGRAQEVSVASSCCWRFCLLTLDASNVLASPLGFEQSSKTPSRRSRAMTTKMM